jgi:hypothetical protein
MNFRNSELGKEAIIEAINNQIENNDPEETKQTYDRLMVEIGDHEEVMKYLGIVMSAEIFNILKNQELFNRQRYIERLNKLPDTSWLDK